MIRQIQRAVFILPPGSGKSVYGSVMFPAGYFARYPNHTVISCSYALALVRRFGRRARNIVASEDFYRVFGFGVSSDTAAADDWATERGGEYYAVGVGGGVTGRRADLIIYDDLVSGRQDADSETIREHTWDWLRNDARTRLKPNGVELFIGTRWHWDDPLGRLLPDYDHGSGTYQGYDGEDYEVINLPALAVKGVPDPLGRKPGAPLWPEYMTADQLERKMREQGGPTSRGWVSLYQGQPSPDEGGILLRKWWKKWTWPIPDKHSEDWIYILQSYDTAYSEKDLKRNSRSARTTWGVLEDPRDRRSTLIVLLEAWADFVDYPELRRVARRAYNDWLPSTVIIEKKASGQSLLQDLRVAGVRVLPYQPDRDKVARAYAVQAMFENEQVWYIDSPETCEVIDECARFPSGVRNDLVDTVTQALIRMRNLKMTRHRDDRDEDQQDEEKTHYMRALKSRGAIYG